MVLNHKYYVLENCPGVMWRQKELTYPEFETILDNLYGFISSLKAEEEFVDSLHRLLKTILPTTIATFVRPYAPTWYRRVWNTILIKIKKIDVNDPIRYMTLSESAGVVNDFFFLNQEWTKSLNGSAGNLGSTVQEVIKASMTMMSPSTGEKSSTFLQKEEPKRSND